MPIYWMLAHGRGTPVEASFLRAIDSIEASEWNRLAGTDYPFLRHEFLAALERTGCASAQSGWLPRHVVLRDDDGRLCGLAPLYLKSHSMGEYVFDWAWAGFWEQHGQAYYPKFLTAVPFSPCSGPRLVADPALPAESRTEIADSLAAVITGVAEQNDVSSWHILFPDPATADACRSRGLLTRHGWQYHWFNHDYADMDAFLASLTSKRRKNIRRELRLVREQGIEFEVLEAEDITPEHWRMFYGFYHATYMKRGQVGYLNLDFFLELSRTMPEHLVLILARRGREPAGAALCLRSATTLYGRYWGCIEDVDCLHFATCYYEGIRYCIQRGLQRFDPGVQGEHKIARGFLPVATESFHWIADPAFRPPLERFLEEESRMVDAVRDRLAAHSPYRQAEEPGSSPTSPSPA